MGKRLKDKINEVQANLQRLYNNLGNIAFWDAAAKAAAAPGSIDWGNPKHKVTLVLSLTNAVVKHNGNTVANGAEIQVEEGETLTLTVEADSGFTLGTVTSNVGTVSGSTVTLVMGSADVTLNITASATATYAISYGTMTHCSTTTAPSTITSNGEATIVFSVDTGYELLRSGITVTNASIKSFDGETLVIENPTGAVTISATAEEPKLKFLMGYFHYINNGVIGVANESFYTNNDPNTDVAPQCVVSEYIHIQAPAESTSSQPTFDVYWGVILGSGNNGAPNYGLPSQWALYRKEQDNTFTYLARREWDRGSESKTDRGASSADVLAAYNAGTLYMRVTLTANSSGIIRKSSSFCVRVNGTSIFYPSEENGVPTNYVLIEPEDWTIDDLNLNGNGNNAE